MTAGSLRNTFRAQVIRGEKPPLVIVEKNRRHLGEDSLDADMVVRSERRSSDHRLGDRHRLTGETAMAVYDGRSFAVELINLSAGGAMIQRAFTPNLWDIIELRVGDGLAVEAAVRWVKGDRIGLEFAHETRIDCDPAERNALLLEVIRRSFDDQQIDLAPEETLAGPGLADEARRVEMRHPLIWMGQLHFAHDCHPVRLRNVSKGGALVDVLVDYPVGARVMLDLGEAGQLSAEIVWACGDQAGLHFHEPFDIACLAMARPQVMSTGAPTSPPDDAASDISPWNEKWSRTSLTQIREELEGYLSR